MRGFVASARLPFWAACLCAVVTIAAYALLRPTGMGIPNMEMVKIFRMVGWGIGPVCAILSLLLIGILNLLRRMVGLRKAVLLHAPIVFFGFLPWLIFSWQLTAEPRYMNIAKTLIDFVGRPLLWGSLAACLFATLVTLIVFFIPQKK